MNNEALNTITSVERKTTIEMGSRENSFQHTRRISLVEPTTTSPIANICIDNYTIELPTRTLTALEFRNVILSYHTQIFTNIISHLLGTSKILLLCSAM